MIIDAKNFLKLSKNRSVKPEDLEKDQSPALLKASLERLEKKGLPTYKEEEWKYTSLKAVSEFDFSWSELKPDKKPEEAKYFISLSGGHVVDKNLPDGVSLTSLKAGDLNLSNVKLNTRENFCNDLNNILFQDLISIIVAEGINIEEPIYLLDRNLGSPEGPVKVVATKVVVQLKKGSRLGLVVDQKGGEQTLLSQSLFVDLKEEASLQLYRLCEGGVSTHIFNHCHVNLERKARLDGFDILLSGKLTRSDLHTNTLGPAANIQLNGMYIAKDEELVDFHTEKNHLHPEGESRQLYKGILAGKSKAVFNGKIFIEKDAQKVDSALLNKNLVVGDKAEVNTKPELEVYADDVKANHGATLGRINEEEVFYLKSRAISEEETMKLLSEAFVKEILLKIENESVRNYFLSKINQRLSYLRYN